MKTKLIFLLPLLLLFINCTDSDTDSSSLKLSESTFKNVDGNGETLRINIESNSAWKVSSDQQWCIPFQEKGDSDGELVLSVVANLDGSSRDATVTIMSSKTSKKIQINQKALNSTAKEYHYKLPIIFHVFYEDKTDALQYVNPNILSEIITEVNKLYKDANKSIDMNLTFTLATIDPEGNEMTTPGVEYIKWPESYPIDCEKFMEDETKGYVNYLWEPNLYINVMVYNFKRTKSNSIILGISNLPFSTKGNNFLKGLVETDKSFLRKSNLKFPYCVSINSIYINDHTMDGNINATVAHELGHYLGLHHVFNERNGETVNACVDSDYCEDTPPYNKFEYDNFARENYGSSFSILALRVNCNTGEQFTSRNIMDYSYSYLNQFTSDQFSRVRHVLMYSPLIPGPKIGQSTSTRAVDDGPLDLPIRIVK